MNRTAKATAGFLLAAVLLIGGMGAPTLGHGREPMPVATPTYAPGEEHDMPHDRDWGPDIELDNLYESVSAIAKGLPTRFDDYEKQGRVHIQSSYASHACNIEIMVRMRFHAKPSDGRDPVSGHTIYVLQMAPFAKVEFEADNAVSDEGHASRGLSYDRHDAGTLRLLSVNAKSIRLVKHVIGANYGTFRNHKDGYFDIVRAMAFTPLFAEFSFTDQAAAYRMKNALTEASTRCRRI